MSLAKKKTLEAQTGFSTSSNPKPLQLRIGGWGLSCCTPGALQVLAPPQADLEGTRNKSWSWSRVVLAFYTRTCLLHGYLFVDENNWNVMIQIVHITFIVDSCLCPFGVLDQA